MEIINKIKVDLNYLEKKPNIIVVQEFEEYSLVRDLSRGSHYFINKEGQKISEYYAWVIYYKESDIFIVNNLEKNLTDYYPGVFYMDKNLNKVSRDYNNAEEFINGLALVEETEGKVYFINTSFERVSPIYKDAENAEQGYLAVKKKDKWHYVNEKFKKVSGAYKDEIYSFGKNGLAIIEKGCKKVFINKDFKQVSPEYFDLKYCYLEDYVVAKVEQDGWCLLSIKNNFERVSPVFQFITVMRNDENHYLVFLKDKAFIVDKEFKKVSEDFENFFVPRPFNYLFNDMIIVRKSKNNFCILDTKNNLKFSETYEMIYNFKEESDYIIVKKDGKWHFINKSFERVSENFDLILPSTKDFNYNFAQKDGVWYVLDRNLKVVTQRICTEEDLKVQISNYNKRNSDSVSKEKYINDALDVPFDADAKIKGYYSCINMDGVSIVVEDENYLNYLEKLKEVMATIDKGSNFEYLENISEVNSLTRTLN